MNNIESDLSTVRIAHLSDIHFYKSTSGDETRHRHSPLCLRLIESHLNDEKLDLIVITGDITNIGDDDSFELARQWIDKQIPDEDEYIGLRAQDKNIPVIAIPGNHDAYDAPKRGPFPLRWQRAVKKFHKHFRDQFFLDNKTVGYRWVEKGATRVFVVYTDSCYLGDNNNNDLWGGLHIGSVARGNFARAQTEAIMKLYDEGIRGNLRKPSGDRISARAFLSSFKILAMHHYLFEPASCKNEPLLQMSHKNTVFQNIAMCDFDAIICGHKHIAEVQRHAYIDYFDTRAKVRHAHNIVRRTLGLASLPLQYDKKGHTFSKIQQIIMGAVANNTCRGQPPTEKDVSDIIDILRRSLENKSVLKDNLLEFFNERENLEYGLLDPEEMRELHFRIMKHLKRGEQKTLAATASSLARFITRLGNRTFAQAMPGSSGKASEKESRKRGFNIYCQGCPV